MRTPRLAYYLAERYVPSMSPVEIDRAIGRLDEGAADERVRHVLSILVHGEDTCLSIFEALDPRAIERVTDRAGFRLDRIVEVTAYPGGRARSRSTASTERSG